MPSKALQGSRVVAGSAVTTRGGVDAPSEGGGAVAVEHEARRAAMAGARAKDAARVNVVWRPRHPRGRGGAAASG